jgi:serine/threonine-protein kinase
MVMELLDGETLTERLRRVRQMDLTQAARLAKHLGKALASAHELGIIHRDLKPGNVFLVCDHDEDLAKVFDFGISKALQPLRDASLTREDAVVGTPRFMSPEQMRGATVDERTDLWSFGVTLYCACTGRMPFQGGNLREVVQAVQHQPAARVNDLTDAALPRELDGFFARALAKQPDERFDGALAMADAFVAIAAPQLCSTPPPPLSLSDIDRTRRIVPPPLPDHLRRARRARSASSGAAVQDITMTIDRPRHAAGQWRAVAAAGALLLSSVAAAGWLATARQDTTVAQLSLTHALPQQGAAARAVVDDAPPDDPPAAPKAAPKVEVAPKAAPAPPPKATPKTSPEPTPEPTPKPDAEPEASAPPKPAPAATTAPSTARSAAASAAPSATPGPHQLFEEPW